MWTNFETLNNEEETISNLFCSNGLFKITSDEKISASPKIAATIQYKKIFLGIDQSLILVENESISECNFLQFACDIDIIIVSHCGSFILCALKDGNIHIISIKRRIPVLSLTIHTEDIGQERSFIGIQQINDIFYFMCSSGTIYKLSHIEENILSESISQIDQNDTCVYNETLNNSNLERLTSKRYYKYINAFFISDINSDLFVIASIHESLLFRHNSTDCVIKLPSILKGTKQFYKLECGLIALSNSGSLYEICPYTYLVYTKNYESFLIDDLIVLENTHEEIELLFLSKPNVNGLRLMRIIQFPSMICVNEFSMPENTWLVQQPKSSVNMYFLCGNKLNTDFLQEIEMKIISQTDPFQKLKKLIQKGYLQEAEEFTSKFNLCRQPILKAKIKKALFELDESKQSDHINIYQTLFQLLNEIDDKSYIITLINTEISNRNCMMILLNFLLERLADDENYKENINEINERLLRLDTLNLIDPYECNMDWLIFIKHPNLINVCKTMFNEDISKVCLIWARHSSSIIPKLDQKIIKNILDLIPIDTEPIYIIHWLKHFVPSVIQYYPNIMTQLVNWCINKTRTLQYSHLWPEIGLEFIGNIFAIFNDITFLFVDIRREYESNIEKMQTLIDSLKDLSTLKSNYFISLTLDEYTKDSDNTAFVLLQRIGIIYLKKLVDNFIFPKFIKKGFSPTPSIIKYIHFLVSNRIYFAEWQKRAVICIELLHNEDERLQCTLLVLKSSQVPWSEIIQPLIKYGRSNHPLATDIYIEYKLQIIKLIKVKYGWSIDSDDPYMKLIFRIVKENHKDMVEDVRDLVTAVPEISMRANFYVGYELARHGSIEKAINFIDNLDEKQSKECCHMTFNSLTHMIDNGNITEPEITYIMEYLTIISQHYPEFDDEKQVNTIQKILRLRNTYQIDVTLETYHKLELKKEFLSVGIENFLNKLKREESGSIQQIWDCICLLNSTLELDKLVIILEMIKQLDNIYLSCNLALMVLELIDVDKFNCENIIQLASYLIVQQTIKGIDVNFGDPLSYPLAYKLLLKSLAINKINYFETNTLIHFVRIGSTLYDFNIIDAETKNINSITTKVLRNYFGSCKTDKAKIQNKRDSMSVFDQVDQINEISKVQCNPKPVLECIGNALKVLLTKFKLKDPPFDRLHNIFQLDLDYLSDEEQIKNDFISSLEHLLKIKQHSPSFCIIQLIMKYQKQTNIFIMPDSFISLIYKRILKNLLLLEKPNYVDTICILLSAKNSECLLSSLKEELKNGHQMINVLTLSEMYNCFTGNENQVTIDKEERLKYFYCVELSKCDSTLKNKTTFDFISISKLTKELRNKILGVDLLKKLSADFHWDYQEVLVKQVIAVLKMQEIKFDVTKDIFGKEEIIVKSTVEEIRLLCQPYINEITNANFLSLALLTMLKEFQINFYFYELYLCIIDILCYIDRLPKDMSLWSSILLFLKFKMIKKRQNRAGQLETDWYLRSQLDNGVLPKIAKYRFPFQPLILEPLKNILDGEINIENCEKWFTLINLHAALTNLNSTQEIVQLQDYFCMSAVKNSIAEYKSSENFEAEIWHLKPINNAFLQSILQLTTHMIRPSKIIFILYFVLNYAPDGADQIEAAYACYTFAIKHENELIENSQAQAIVVKIKRKYPILKTQHLLHLYGIGTEDLFQLVENPNELIKALYNHDCILQSDKPDINKLAMEVAELHNLDFKSIQFGLLQKWLSLTNDGNDENLNDTFYEEFNPISNGSDSDNLCNENVLRAHFILSTWSSEESFQFLISHLYAPHNSINTGTQLQLFECFTKLINESNLSVIELDIVNQKEYIIIKCIHHLKDLGYNFTVDKFKEYNKVNLLKSIWQKKAGDPKALEVMCYICVGFEIFIPQIWNGVLKQMVNLNMIDQLSKLIVLLSVKSSLLHISGLISAWECVIKSVFKNANKTRSDEQETVLCKSLILLQSCPVASKINLVEVAEMCIRLERPHMAAILIMFGKPEQKTIIINLIKQHHSESLRSDIEDLEHHGIVSTITKFVINQLDL